MPGWERETGKRNFLLGRFLSVLRLLVAEVLAIAIRLVIMTLCFPLPS